WRRARAMRGREKSVSMPGAGAAPPMRSCRSNPTRRRAAKRTGSGCSKPAQELEEYAATDLGTRRDVGEFAVPAIEKILAGDRQFEVRSRSPGNANIHRGVGGHHGIGQCRDVTHRHVELAFPRKVERG